VSLRKVLEEFLLLQSEAELLTRDNLHASAAIIAALTYHDEKVALIERSVIAVGSHE